MDGNGKLHNAMNVNASHDLLDSSIFYDPINFIYDKSK